MHFFNSIYLASALFCAIVLASYGWRPMRRGGLHRSSKILYVLMLVFSVFLVSFPQSFDNMSRTRALVVLAPGLLIIFLNVLGDRFGPRSERPQQDGGHQPGA